MVRFPAIVTRKSLPSEASTVIVAASVSATTAGATAPDSVVVAADAGEAKTSVSTDPPAAVTAATPAARLNIFLRLSVSGEAAFVPLSSKPASPERHVRRRAGDRLSNAASVVSRVPATDAVRV
jgi:hypothetical protein